jgi:hypothetical protein
LFGKSLATRTNLPQVRVANYATLVINFAIAQFCAVHHLPPRRTPLWRPSTEEQLMRTFASAFLSAIAAVTISGTLFSVVLI